MDVKLAKYRNVKKREKAIIGIKETLNKGISWVLSTNSKMPAITIENSNDENKPTSTEENDKEDSIDNIELCDSFSWSNFLLYASLWAILYSLAIYVEFGAVYFVISILFIIYYNTRTGPKERGELSAYSVFNQNCESIKGTLKAEQFEQELRYGALHT
uniref:SAYSvFN domain-containing protein n=1 Tax=Clastoptera arizonana TaxID=38151 RepID=A0A1B6DY18_9HEMI